MKTLEEMKSWYIDAVKAQLILNFALLEAEADRAVRSYKLKEKLDKDPEDQLNNSIEGVAEDIARKNFIGRPSSLSYKGYTTEIRYDSSLKHLYGKIEGIGEFISFESELSGDVEAEFHHAVDDYLSYCSDRGIIPETGMEDAFGGDAEALDDWRRRHGIAGRPLNGLLSDPEGSKKADDFEKMISAVQKTSDRSDKAAAAEEDLRSDIDLLKQFGIDPDEETLDFTEGPDLSVLIRSDKDSEYSEDTVKSSDPNGIESIKRDPSKQIDVRTGLSREDLQGMQPDQYLRFMGIDPDDVIL